MHRFRIRTNWTNSVSKTHEFGLDDLSDGAVLDKLKWAMSDPERLRPGETKQTVTERAARTFAQLAQSLRDRGHAPQDVAQFVNRLSVLHVRRGRWAASRRRCCSHACLNARAVGRRSSARWHATCSERCPSGAGSDSRPWSGLMAGSSRMMLALPLDRDTDRDCAASGRTRLVQHRSVDLGHSVRERPRPRQAIAARCALYGPGQDYADH